MKIFLDMRLLTGQMHGMARYALELLGALLAEDVDFSVGALVTKPGDAAALPKDPRVVAVATGLKPYGIAAQMSLPRILDSLRPDVYHCPFYAAPSRFNGPMVITIHDLIHLRFPADYGLRHRFYYKYVVLPAVRRARAVLTVSQHSKKDLIELMGVRQDKITVTPNGVGRAFRPLAPEEARAALAGVEAPERFVLGVGNPKPHKNLRALAAAMERLEEAPPEGAGQIPPLVLVGVGPGQLKGVSPGPRVVMLPHLADETLAALYSLAEIVVAPSLYEGFGLPALEAMACGAPVVAADRASLPEVVGEAGLLSKPDAESLAGTIGRLLANQKLRRRLSLLGPEQAGRFTWRETARKTLKVYRRVAGGHA